MFVTTRAPNAGVEAILDEADGEPWIAQFGSWSSRANSGAFAGFFVQDDNTEKGTKSVVYRPLLPESGTYAIEIWYPQRANAGTNIPVDIIFGVVTNTVVVNQRKNGSRWNALGNYNLPAGTNAAVRIRNDDASGYVEADAVRFIR